MLQTFPGTWTGLALVAFSAGATALGMTSLKPESVDAWSAYVAATERRIATEVASGDGFLATDREADAGSRRRALRAGTILVDDVVATGDDGEGVEMPSAMLHDWRGAVFIPGATLDRMLDELATGAPGTRQDDVLASRLIERTPDSTRVFVRVQRKKFVTVVLDTEHLVRFRRLGPARATSRSTATRIAEVVDVGSASERQLTPGQDRGFLWRWNAYWRYEQVPGGVIAECESLSLSRDIPWVFRPLVAPLVRSTAEESMTRTLAAFRDRFSSSPAQPDPVLTERSR